MDPYKVLGLSQHRVKNASDIGIARNRARQLWKRYTSEKNKFDAEKVLQAFEIIKQNLKNGLGEGVYKILGRSRKERELDKHFNHQTKEIKGNKDLKRVLKRARSGEKRFHLPGDKEKVARPRRRRRRRRREIAVKKMAVLEGLQKLFSSLPSKAKFPKVVKLLYRWVKEYMTVANREYVLLVLDNLVNCDHLTTDAVSRPLVIDLFEYMFSSCKLFFDQDLNCRMLGRCWHVSAVLSCQCFTDDAFILSSTIARLSEALDLMLNHQDEIDDVVEVETIKLDKFKFKMASAGRLTSEHVKLDQVKSDSFTGRSVNGCLGGLRTFPSSPFPTSPDSPFPASPFPLSPFLSPRPSSLHQSFSSDEQEKSEIKSISDTSELEEVKEDNVKGNNLKKEDVKKEEVQTDLIELGSEEEDVKEEISSDSSSDGETSSDVEEVEMPTFDVPSHKWSLGRLRIHFVERCLATLFLQRGTAWATHKIDSFFQSVFYKRHVFTQEQQTKIEAWQARIKTLQKVSERVVGAANNPLEPSRPVVDSREMRTMFDADSNAWAAKQTFDSRDKNGARQVIR